VVVLDTCALLWWSFDPTQLSGPAAGACKLMERQGGWISSISIWEIGLKVNKGKYNIGMPLQDFVSRLRRTAIQIIPVDETVWVENLALPWKHTDPADRTIVATAKARGLPIMTADQEIRSFYPQIIW
jgi:PIN domain nuclease of toxin-antitoxin system